jgi:hypothetical protein
MIPALPQPAIRHRPEQFEQIIADFGDRRRRGRRSRAAISNRNGRLDHGEAPETTRIYRKTSCHTEASSCFPQLRRTRSPRTSRGETHPVNGNNLETATTSASLAVLQEIYFCVLVGVCAVVRFSPAYWMNFDPRFGKETYCLTQRA